MTSLAVNSGQTDLPAHNEAKTKDATQSAGLAPQGLQSHFKPTWGYAEKPKQDGVLKSVGKEVLKGAMFTSPLGIGLYTGYKVANHAANAWVAKKKDSAMPLYGNGIYGNAMGKKSALEKTAQNRVVSGVGNDVYGNAMGEKKAWYEGNCEHCKQPFKKKTTWQRFCCTEHQAAAYELRTGKKWYGKKTGG